MTPLLPLAEGPVALKLREPSFQKMLVRVFRAGLARPKHPIFSTFLR